MSMAIILYQCIATTQCQLSLFGQAKFLLSTTTPILFSICMARLFALMQLLWKFRWQLFCISTGIMKIFFANQYRHYENFLLISEMQYGNGFCLIANFCVKCSMEMVFD
jgi:hypothetical protein